MRFYFDSFDDDENVHDAVGTVLNTPQEARVVAAEMLAGFARRRLPRGTDGDLWIDIRTDIVPTLRIWISSEIVQPDRTFARH